MSEVAKINETYKKTKKTVEGPSLVKLVAIDRNAELPFVVEPADEYGAPFGLSAQDAQDRYGINPNLPKSEREFLKEIYEAIDPETFAAIKAVIHRAEAEGTVPRNLIKARRELAEELDRHDDPWLRSTPEEVFAAAAEGD